MGETVIDIPRDRNGEYEPAAIPKGISDVSELERKVLSMYSKGTSDRDISDVINDIYGFKLSPETISNIVDRVTPMVVEWQNRKLEKVYPFVYMDCLQISVKTERRAGKHAFYTMIAINADGRKDCLGFWMSENEGANYWLSVFSDRHGGLIVMLFFKLNYVNIFHDIFLFSYLTFICRSHIKYIIH